MSARGRHGHARGPQINKSVSGRPAATAATAAACVLMAGRHLLPPRFMPTQSIAGLPSASPSPAHPPAPAG